ncbi:MAG: PAS domain S-box protein, partial [Cytophagales bacterium]|nr:PAS domain S-box protein [Cytophagales bacterium]
NGAVSWLLGQGTPVTDAQHEPVSVTGIDMDITGRKLDEEKIRESEERFRSLADTAPVFIWMADENAAGVYFNQPWLDFTGRSLDRERGNGWAEGVHPEDLPRRLEVFTNALRDRKSFKMEYRLRRHDGSYCWVLDHGVPRFLPDGAFVGYLGSCVNIHDRVEAEARLKRLFDSGMLGVIEFSFESGITSANDQFLHLIGYTREDMDGGRIDWTGLTPPEYRHLDELSSRQLQETGVAAPYEKEIVRKDGSRAWIMVGAALLEKKLNAGIAFVLDTTVQQTALLRLRQNEERFRVAIENSPILVFNCDADLRYTWVYNNAATARQEDAWLVGKTDLEIMQHPDEARRMMDLKRQVFREGVGRKEEVQVTIDGQPHSYILTMEPLRDEAGTVTGLTCATFDISERKAAEERIRESEAKLRRLFDSGITGIVFWNRQGKILDANNTFLQQMGYTRQELEADQINWVAMTPPEYAERDAQSLRDLAATGVSIPFEKEYIRKDGTRIPVLVGAATLEGFTDQGVAFILDITERKQAEEQVHMSQRLLYEVFENSADALFLINAEGNIVERYNQQAVLLFELEDNQKYVGLPAQNLQKHAFTEAESAEVLQQLAARGFWSAELEYVSVRGREFWGNAAVSFINVNEQRYFLIRIRDITDRKRFEEKLQKNQRVLESIFEGVADALFLIDPASNRIVNCNRQVVKLFEFESKEDVIGRSGNELQKTPFTAEETAKIRREIWTRRYWSSEVKYVTRKGREFWGDIAITVVPFEDKEYLLVRVGDINDRKLSQEQLRKSQQELLRQKQRTEEALAIIAEDNERKTQELEEARSLQLSMLPQKPPSLPYLDVAMIMKTSAEVGGDYYDYKLHESGDITLVIGDATGHGLKAGIVVATVKSYFQTLAGQYEATELLRRISEGIQNLQIRGMYMGLTVMHFSQCRLLIASSGMPPLYLYRRATGRVETILLKGLFLGSRLDVPIQQQIFPVGPGDTLLALTDGLPELFNEGRDMLDYPSIEQSFRSAGHLSPQQIIDQLLTLGQQWNHGAPNEDDITLLAVQVKEPPPPAQV